MAKEKKKREKKYEQKIVLKEDVTFESLIKVAVKKSNNSKKTE